MNPYINTLTREQKLAVIKECNRLARGGKPKNQWGLCRNLGVTAGVHGYRIVGLLASTWKHHSGDSVYPVAGNFYDLGVRNELWLGKHGKLRRSLARHIAKKIEGDTMSMTLDEMKLAVCEILPEYFDTKSFDGWLKPNTKLNPDKHCVIPCNWEALGLQVCHEAEKLLFINARDWESYRSVLGYMHRTKTHNTHVEAHINATHEQRLEALCRVWFPERFQH